MDMDGALLSNLYTVVRGVDRYEGGFSFDLLLHNHQVFQDM